MNIQLEGITLEQDENVKLLGLELDVNPGLMPVLIPFTKKYLGVLEFINKLRNTCLDLSEHFL